MFLEIQNTASKGIYFYLGRENIYILERQSKVFAAESCAIFACFPQRQFLVDIKKFRAAFYPTGALHPFTQRALAAIRTRCHQRRLYPH